MTGRVRLGFREMPMVLSKWGQEGQGALRRQQKRENNVERAPWPVASSFCPPTARFRVSLHLLRKSVHYHFK